MLIADVARRLDGFALEASVEVGPGATLALIGESGSGKTTLLRLIAGLLHPDRGRIEVAGRTWFDAGRSVDLDACRRPVGYVAQGYALFPHLTARENVAFGLRATGLSRARAHRRADETLARLGLGSLADRRPAKLSGGQRQRVAIARALVLEPEALLLDEPLAALDLPTRAVVRRELRAQLSALPCRTIVVTHSPIEALGLGDRVAVLEHGRLTQTGTREELLRRPRSAYVAAFLGLNFVRAVVTGREGALLHARAGGGELHVADDPALAPAAVGDEITVTLDPREVSLSLEAPHGSARNVLAGVVEEITAEPPDGERLRVALATAPPLTAEITRAAAQALALAPGVRAWAAFKATGLRRVG